MIQRSLALNHVKALSRQAQCPQQPLIQAHHLQSRETGALIHREVLGLDGVMQAQARSHGEAGSGTRNREKNLHQE